MGIIICGFAIGLESDILKSLNEGKSIIVEGMHLDFRLYTDIITQDCLHCLDNEGSPEKPAIFVMPFILSSEVKFQDSLLHLRRTRQQMKHLPSVQSSSLYSLYMQQNDAIIETSDQGDALQCALESYGLNTSDMQYAIRNLQAIQNHLVSFNELQSTNEEVGQNLVEHISVDANSLQCTLDSIHGSVLRRIEEAAHRNLF